MKPTTKDKVPDTLTLAAEAEGIAAGINACFTFLKEWDDPERPHDQPSAGTLSDLLWGLEQHLLRLTEDWVCYTGQLEDQLKEYVGSDRKGAGV